mmetsp:Transcript_77247/g.179127  ORF Transcript_77247/g.179127 Transcript_77247/m.179127 type:complete len:586 (+) Transcript_77247:95-1852(+)
MAERRLKRALQGKHLITPNHVALLEDLTSAAEADFAADDVSKTADEKAEREKLTQRATRIIAKLKNSLEARLTPLRAELDQDERHSCMKVWAGLRYHGLEPEEIGSPPTADDIKVDSRIPVAERAEMVKEQRLEVWQGLRESRIEELKKTLTGLSEDDVRRYVRTGGGTRMVEAYELPSVDSLAGMDDFNDLQQRKYAKLKAEQQRKADLLVTGFLQEKKRMEEADAKIAAFEKRLAEQRKAEEAARKAKRAEKQKKEEKQQAQVHRCAQERREWEDEVDAKIVEKLVRSEQIRNHGQQKDVLRDRLASADWKRREAMRKALQLEENLLDEIATRQEALEKRLQERNVRVEEELRLRAEASQAKFHDKQMRIYEQEEAWASEKLQVHQQFKDKVDKVRANHTAFLQARSKSCSEILRKAHDRQKANYDKEKNRRHEASQALLERHQADHTRSEDTTLLKLKCDNDVFTFREVKYNTWGELQRQRHKELTQSRENHHQALVFKLAEFDKKVKGQQESNGELHRRRQLVAKESLTLNDHAKVGFNKIQCEPDERKIHAVMTGLGFTMPTLPDEKEEEQGPEESKPAF